MNRENGKGNKCVFGRLAILSKREGLSYFVTKIVKQNILSWYEKMERMIELYNENNIKQWVRSIWYTKNKKAMYLNTCPQRHVTHIQAQV